MVAHVDVEGADHPGRQLIFDLQRERPATGQHPALYSSNPLKGLQKLTMRDHRSYVIGGENNCCSASIWSIHKSCDATDHSWNNTKAVPVCLPDGKDALQSGHDLGICELGLSLD